MSDYDRNQIAIRMSYGALGVYDARYRRKIGATKRTPPTAADWAEYERARAMLEELRESPYFEDGGPEEKASVEPPVGRTEYSYTETEDEWRERCAKITGPRPPGINDAPQTWFLGIAHDQMGGGVTNADADI